MTPTRRQRLALLIVLVGGALLVARVASLALADAEVDAPVAPRARGGAASASAAAASAEASSRVQLERLEARQRALADDADHRGPRTPRPALFEVVAWQPPPPKAPPPPPPPKPVAPPFPYAYIGGLSEEGVRTSFFLQGNRVLAVKAGDTVDAAYRIEQMTKTQMTLTYLPLEETMVLALGVGS